MKTLILAGALFSVTVVASSHHSLNGTWILIPDRSNFGGQPAIQTGSVTINDRQGNITVSRNYTYDGATHTLSYIFAVDGRENSTIQNETDLKVKAKWEGRVLKVTITREGIVTVERYSLEPDGTMMLNAEMPGHNPMSLVFQRQ
jgi:hypothetical protein